MVPLPRLVAGIAGGVVLAITFWDAFITTLVVSRAAGPVTARMTTLASRVLSRTAGSRRSRGAWLLGPAFLVGTVVAWVAMLWLGWFLIFVSAGGVVVEASTGAPAGTFDTAYFTGFNLFTLGVGDYVATTPVWRTAAVVSSFTGLFLITLAITYLLSVGSAAVAGRALAVHVHGLGTSPEDIVIRAWSGSGFVSSLEQHLVSLTQGVAAAAEQHLAYPVLHIFHARARSTSGPIGIADLADAMHLLQGGVAADRVPGHAAHTLLVVIDRYADTATSLTGGRRSRCRPPSLDLGRLSEAGIPVVGNEAFAHHLEEVDARRRMLAEIVESSGWAWSLPRH